MQHHPYFDLWLHTDAELSRLLAAPLAARVTLHEWPLSCVQQVTLADGARLIYKAQTSEGVEADFYARVRSPLLPLCRLLGQYQNTQALCLEYIDAPRLDRLARSEAEVVRHGQALTAAIREMDRAEKAPVYANLGSPDQWASFVDDALAKLHGLLSSGQFQQVRPEVLPRLAGWARSAPVVQASRANPGLAHADLSGENVFVTPGGYKIVDWQYPRVLPEGFDLACLLDFSGYDAYHYVDAAVVNIAWFVRLAWFVEFKLRLFPAGETYDADVDWLARQILGEEEER